MNFTAFDHEEWNLNDVGLEVVSGYDVYAEAEP